jgi:hypothetical protein
MEICEDVDPEIIEMSDGHWVACHLYDDPSLKKDKPI